MKSEIKITNMQQAAVIDIEGVIGVPEQMQFDTPGDRVATYSRFASSLAKLRELRVEEVVVNIRSTGGDVNDALLIFDALKGLNAKVTTCCYGYVASAATIIAQAASEGRREISSNALYLIHCSESVAEGNARSLAQTKDLLDKTDIRIASVYAERAGRAVEDYIELMNENGGKGRWISAEETLEAGLADVIVSAQVRNLADEDGLSEAAELCRLFGLTPPDAPESGVETNAESGKGYSRMRMLWNTFLRLFGGRDEEAADSSEESAAGVDLQQEENVPVQNEPEEKRDNVPAEALSDESVIPESPGKITAAFKAPLPCDKTVILERLGRQSEAFATSTTPVEDPSIDEQSRSANQEAYEQDVMSLKSTL